MQSTPCLVLGKGFRGWRIEWRYLWFDKIQMAADGHLGMMELLHVTFASAGLSCSSLDTTDGGGVCEMQASLASSASGRTDYHVP